MIHTYIDDTTGGKNPNKGTLLSSSRLQGVHCDRYLGASANSALCVCVEPGYLCKDTALCWLIVSGIKSGTVSPTPSLACSYQNHKPLSYAALAACTSNRARALRMPTYMHTEAHDAADQCEHRHKVNAVAACLGMNIICITTGHKKPKLTHTACAGRLLSWLQGNSNTKNTGKVHHDRNEACMQYNTTSGTAGCPSLITADTTISQVAYKHTLLM